MLKTKRKRSASERLEAQPRSGDSDPVQDAVESPLAVIVGVGPGNGAAFVRRFAAEGHRVAMLARSAGTMDELARQTGAHAYPCDVTDPAAVTEAFARITADLGPTDVLVYNAGKGVWGNAEEISIDDFEAAWRTNTLGALVAARAVAPAMRTRGHGAIVFIGATASLRGGARFAGFASAKAAQRSLAQSLARQLWPAGIHVCLVIVDGVIDEPVARKRLADKPDDFFLKPDDIAGTVLNLVRQPRSAWSFEVEVRPFGESW